MSCKQFSVMVAVLVLALAAVALSAQVEGPAKGGLVCNACKQLVAQSKDQLPAVKPQLEQLCNYCGSPASTQKCVKAIDAAIDKLEHESPEQICTEMGLCKKAAGGLNSLLGF